MTVTSDPGSGPVVSGPIESSPVEAGPVEAGPVESSPVEAGPVESSTGSERRRWLGGAAAVVSDTGTRGGAGAGASSRAEVGALGHESDCTTTGVDSGTRSGRNRHGGGEKSIDRLGPSPRGAGPAGRRATTRSPMIPDGALPVTSWTSGCTSAGEVWVARPLANDDVANVAGCGVTTRRIVGSDDHPGSCGWRMTVVAVLSRAVLG